MVVVDGCDDDWYWCDGYDDDRYDGSDDGRENDWYNDWYDGGIERSDDWRIDDIDGRRDGSDRQSLVCVVETSIDRRRNDGIWYDGRWYGGMTGLRYQ